MKKTIKYIGSFFIAILTFSINAQTTSQNHVVSKTYKVKSTSILNTQNPDSVATAIQYFDELGRIKQSVMVKAGSGGFGNNTVPYDWSIGNASQSSFYTIYGSGAENQIISGTTPFGHTDLLWECVNDASTGADGGFTTDYISVDVSKPYRYTLWIKRTGNLSDGVNYFGGGVLKNLDGSANANPYFQIGDLPQIDTWYLMVGYVHPSDYSGSDIGISGVYDKDGNKILDGTEYKWDGSVSDVRFNMYLANATDTNTRQYFWSPVVQKIDGSEDTLDDIVNNSSVIDNQEIAAKDIITHFEYDMFGRQKKEYLPYTAASSDGRYRKTAESETRAYYLENYSVDFPGITDPGGVNAYSQTIFEDNLLNRPVEQTAPGLAWKHADTYVNQKEYSTANSIKFDYEYNSANEVKYYPVTVVESSNIYTPSLGFTSYYAANELTKTITKDENWTENQTHPLDHTTEEFKDKNGQVVLKRTYDGNVAHDTYYAYDVYGNLTYVLPPKASDQTITQTVLDELCYQYIYDYRNRLVEKKIPGKGKEYIIYDKLDRPVLTQDALQRENDKWLFTKYDALGRVAYTGEYVTSINKDSIQSTVSSQSAFNSYEDTVTIAPTVIGGEDVYYTSRSFPNTTNLEVFTVSYYDEYLHLPTGLTPPTSIYGESVTTQTKGLATVSKVRVLGTTNWITSVTYYDDKARPLYVYSENEYLQTTDIIESKLDFIGKVLESHTTHFKVGQTDSIITVDRFEYDHMDRLISQTQKVNEKTTERLVRNNYDDLGQLESKLTGNGTAKGYTNVTSDITITDDLVTKSGTNGWGTGFASIGNFQKDGYVEYAMPLTNKLVLVYLKKVNNVNEKYGIHHNNGVAQVLENGVAIGASVTFTNNDRFKIERIGQKIYYMKNDDIFHVSSELSFEDLFADAALYHDGTQIEDFHIVDNSKGLQNVDYAYNVRGWLKTINEDTQSDNDLFDFIIRYNDPTASGTALFNGNISQTAWNTASPVDPSNPNPISSSYDYTYDALNRIKSATDNTGNYNLTSVSYDKNGNILTLQRKGHTNVSETLFGIMDDLVYTYDNGNKLIKVDELEENTTGFKDVSGTDYTYDVNGNMISDGNKGIDNISYNHLNLPTKVSFGTSQYIDYVYDAVGMKLEKKVVDNGNTTVTDYTGNYIYENDVLQFFNHAEGYVKVESGLFDYIYQYKDHLGNVRISYNDRNNDGDIDVSLDPNVNELVEESNYYPFGLKHKGYNNVVSSNGNSIGQKYKTFQGQKIDDELGLNWHAFKWRNYDASLARFHNIDPLAQEYSYQSPYNFSENRVIDGVELEGLEYVSAKDARLEVRSNAQIHYKVENWSWFFRNNFSIANNDPKYWPDSSKQIGVGQIGEVNFTFRRPTISSWPGTTPTETPNAKSTKKPDKRFSSLGLAPKTKAGGRVLGAVAVIDFGVSIAESWGAFWDYWGYDRDKKKLKLAQRDLINYIREGLLDPQYFNEQDLSNLINVIFQGESESNNPDILTIGLNIYNRYQDMSMEQRQFWNQISEQTERIHKEREAAMMNPEYQKNN